MNKLFNILWHLFLSAGWAPASVLVLHAVLAELGLRKRCDHLLHFLGGVAIAYFCYRAVRFFSLYLGRMPSLARYVLAFSVACTIALFWEIGEFLGDGLRGTQVQLSVSETMLDLIWGVLGAALSLLVIRLVEIAQEVRSRARTKLTTGKRG